MKLPLTSGCTGSQPGRGAKAAVSVSLCVAPRPHPHRPRAASQHSGPRGAPPLFPRSGNSITGNYSRVRGGRQAVPPAAAARPTRPGRPARPSLQGLQGLPGPAGQFAERRRVASWRVAWAGRGGASKRRRRLSQAAYRAWPSLAGPGGAACRGLAGTCGAVGLPREAEVFLLALATEPSAVFRESARVPPCFLAAVEFLTAAPRPQLRVSLDRYGEGEGEGRTLEPPGDGLTSPYSLGSAVGSRVAARAERRVGVSPRHLNPPRRPRPGP